MSELVFDDGKIRVFHGDSMEAMRVMRDKQYSLAIVDPPYAHNSGNAFTSRLKRYGQLDFNKVRPGADYFNELRRVSVHQVVWGGNYFIDDLESTKCMLVWDKHQPVATYARLEVAWTSFQDRHTHLIDRPYFGSHGSDPNRVHPNQKPIKLYKEVLGYCAKPGDTILDTHGGSLSLAIACHDLGYSLDVWEIDSEYIQKGVERLKRHQQQLQLFTP